MKRIHRWLLLFVVCTGTSAVGTYAQTAAAGYPPTVSLDEIRKLIDKVPAEHPRLLTDERGLAALRESIDGDPLRRALSNAVVEQAKMMWNLDPVERSLQGRRLLGQSRLCLKRVLWLAMAFHLTGDLQHVRRCEKEMLAAARFSDWNPSHFLDVAEMTLALAIGYDWLFEQLGAPSRNEIRKAIIEKGVALPFETEHNGWVRARNNWGQVCHGGLTAGALAVLEYEPDLAARTVHSALRNVTYSMHAYAPNGSYPEGPAYWSYGTTFNVVLISLIETVLGSDFGLSKAPGFSKTGQYLSLVTGPSGLFFNYADGGASRGLQPALFWFASRYNQPDWLYGEPERLLAGISRLGPKQAASSSARLLPVALLWMGDSTSKSEISLPLNWNSEGETPVTVHRSSWIDPEATFVGLKGGSPSSNHGQMDTGSFVLDACGVRWAVDLGAEGYHGIESRGMNLWSRAQDSDRWTIFRQSNLGHNTLVIDGQPQQVSGQGLIIQFSDKPEFPHSIVDMTSVYAGQAKSVRRGIALQDSRNVLIQDQLSGLEPGSRVRWGMITPASVKVINDSTIELKQEDATLSLMILSPQVSKWIIINTEEPRNEWDSPNPGTRMVAFEDSAPQAGELTFAVLATPCGSEQSQQAIDVRPLENWQK